MTADRPELEKLLATSREGDVVIIPAVDRLSRDTTDLLVIARELQKAGAGHRSLAEPIVDATSDFAEIVLAALGVAAKLERWRIMERTAVGRAHPKGPGRQIRPPPAADRDLPPTNPASAPTSLARAAAGNLGSGGRGRARSGIRGVAKEVIPVGLLVSAGLRRLRRPVADYRPYSGQRSDALPLNSDPSPDARNEKLRPPLRLAR
ncbi:MAG: recombinase family protein [Hyphomicrobiales bacterium]|nr:recombinase family protein [Hyphomicrobiales bacterium]